jgi:4-hydroxy-tetrahydrodipicolinate reductase
MIRLLVQGAGGRLGQMIMKLAANSETFEALPLRRGESWNKAEDIQVALDVSEPSASLNLARQAAIFHKPLVVGTTGHSVSQLHELEALAAQIPVVLAPNFSVGVNLLFWLTAQASRVLRQGFDLEVIELHHGRKKDAPSGTALRLAAILAGSRDVSPENAFRHGRVGPVGERLEKEIGIHALRGGDVAGEHTVLFLGSGERLELIHRASNRETFAQGSLKAAAWIQDQPAGLYDMQDVLGLK